MWYRCAGESEVGNGIGGPGKPNLDCKQWVARLEPEWGPLLGSKALSCMFGRGVHWLG